MGEWDNYKCGVCGRTGLAWQACDYPGCPDGREPERPKPHIDFVATYKVPRSVEPLSWFITICAIVIIVAAVVMGWKLGTYMHEHGIFLL